MLVNTLQDNIGLISDNLDLLPQVLVESAMEGVQTIASEFGTHLANAMDEPTVTDDLEDLQKQLEE